MGFQENILPEIVNVGVFDAETIYNNKSVTPYRNVSLFEIELSTTDGGRSYINNKKYDLIGNDIICAKPGSVRRTELPFKCYYVHVVAKSKYYCDILSSIPDFFHTSDNGCVNRLKKLFEEIINEYSFPKKNGELLIQSKFLEIVYLLYENAHTLSHEMENTVNEELIINTLEYIDRNYTEKINLSDIADNAHLSRIYFRNLFKSATGMTPYEYVLNFRLTKAKKMIIMSDKTFSEIAYDCGFSSQSYFNYVFKREIGITPQQYKVKISQKYFK